MTKKHGPNERIEQNSRKRAKQNGDKQSIRCRVQNMVIRMLKELSEFCNNIKKTQAKMKVILSEREKNLQGTNSGGHETEYQIKDLEHKEEKSIQSDQQAEKRIFKNEDRKRSLWNISKHTNIQIIGMPEGEKGEQKIENLFEKIMDNFLNLVKEIDIQIQEMQRASNKMNPKRPTPRHIIIKMQSVKDK